MLIALVLSQKIGTHSMLRPKSLSCLIHRSCAEHDVAATYSASAVDNATEFCFFDPHEIRHDP